jgi:hypothetical protein
MNALKAANPGLYNSGTGEFCTGDAATSLKGSPVTNGPALSLTTYDITGFDSDNVDLGKAKKLDAFGASDETKTYPSFTTEDGSLAAELSKNGSLKKTFRQWDTFAVLYPTDVSISHDYIIEARTPLNSYGNNHYSLRVGVGTPDSGWNTTAAKKLSLSAKGHLTVYTNANATESKSFYFAKLTNSQAGRTIDLNLFDVGDGAAPLDVELIKPKNATGLDGFASGFGNCEQLGPKTLHFNRMPCHIDDAEGSRPGYTPVVDYNGRNVTLRFTIPDTYRCNDDGGTGCWMGLRFNTSNAVYDTTTWEILDCGKPLRLIQPGLPDVQDTCPSPSGAKGAPTTTTKKPTTTTKKPTTTTSAKPGVTTTKKPSTSTTKKPSTTTSKKPGATTSTTKPSTPTTKVTTTTKKPIPTTTPTTQKPTTSTTWIGGT